MKENRVSLYDVEIIYDLYTGGPKPVTVSLYDIEVISDIPSLIGEEKQLYISSYNLEVLHAYIPEILSLLESTPYYFSGKVSDDVTFINREVISYNRATYHHMDTSFSDGVEGSFFLDSSTGGTCFLVCLDDVGGTSYNHLVAAIVDPAPASTYGYTQSNPGKSAYDIKQNNLAATYDGMYWIQPDTYTSPIQVYCDMTTQGGGWTMCARWDRDFPGAWESCLPLGAMRSNINVADMVLTKAEGNFFAATINVIPIIANGSTTFMHRSIDLTDRYWKHTYFSDIYQVIIDNPENIFDASFDTNDTESVTGIVVGASSSLKNRWYNYNMDYINTYDLQNTSYNYFLNEGEGVAMFTGGSRNGAQYCSHMNSTCDGNGSPHVFWGFYGKDGTTSDFGYTYPMCVGTESGATYLPSCRFNFMFIR